MTRKPGVAGGASVEIFEVDLAACTANLETIERAFPRLSPSDHKRSEALAGDEEAQRLWRAARIATRLLLERFADASAIRQVDFQLSDRGRPAVAIEPPYFSVSHSGSLALVAISLVAPIGVDVELHRAVGIQEPRRGRIIAAGRRLAGLTPSLAADDAELLRAWVRLEAVAKALGIGIGRLLTAEGIPESRAQSQALMRDVKAQDLEVRDGYAAVASRDLPQQIAVRPFRAVI